MLRAALLAVVATTALAPAVAGAATTVRAGAAAADITPPVGTPQFAYTARSYVFDPGPQAADRAVQLVDDFDAAMYAKTFEPSTGIHTRVYARAIVLEQGGQKYALAMADLGGLPYALTQTVLDKLKAANTGIDADHLLLSATHTHSSTGPIWPADNSGYGFVGGDAFDPRIFELTAASIAEAIIGADKRLEPARVGVGTAELRDASRNREYDVYLRDHDLPSSDAEKRAQSIDPTVTVVRVDDAQGRPMALWSNFAIHGTSFGDDNHLLSGDNMSVSERLAEREIAERAPGTQRRPVVNVWTNGA
jgi:neutral ceramidase